LPLSLTFSLQPFALSTPLLRVTPSQLQPE
jgi:hypothetical protein